MIRSDEADARQHAARLPGVALLLLLLFGLASTDPAHAREDRQASGSLATKRVLILNAYGFAFPASHKTMPTLLTTLHKGGVDYGDLFIEYLDLERIPDEERRSRLRDYIQKKYSDNPIDIIITLYDPALKFVLQEGMDLAPNAPVVALYGPETLDATPTNRKVVLLPVRMDLAGTLRRAIELFPGTRRVVLMNGSGPEDQTFLRQAQADFEPWKGRLEFDYATNQTERQAMDHVKNLPDRSIIIFASYLKDKTGHPLVPQEVAANISRAANAPVFGVYDTLLGAGVIGGSMWSFEADGTRVAHVVLDILDGTLPLQRPVTLLTPQWLDIFDWTQLERWNAQWGNLPEGVLFVNRPETLWGKYRNAVMAVVAVTGVLAILALALFLQGRRRKQAEETARASETRFRRAIEEAPAPIMIHAEDGQVLTLSRAWTEITGYSHADIPTISDWTRRAYGARMQMVRSYIQTLYKSRERKDEGEYCIICMDGSKRIWNFYSVPIGSLPDGRRMVLSMAFDVTKHKQLESDLISSKTAAEAASQAKSEFLANMSHEVRTPLNGVLGMLQLLETTEPDQEQTEYILTAIKSANRLTHLLSDILDISRIEAGKLRMVESTFAFSSVTKSIEELFNVEAKKKGLLLDLHTDKDVPPALVGDEARLRQILLNLVGNSIKFTEKGDVRVAVSTLSTPDESPVRVLVTVSDTGIGIHDENAKNIYEPFFQVEDSYSRNFQGAGLGLSIVKRLVTLMEGSITLDSTPGQGTTFYLALPFKLPTKPITLERAPVSKLPSNGETTLRILFAEDDVVNRTSSKLLLERSGYLVTPASDGREALQLLGEEDFDIVLMDIQMPVMDGLEATKAIRNAPDLGQKAHVPIIAMTACAMADDRRRFLAAGMDDFIAKPVDIRQLCAVIERVAAKAAGTICS